MVVDVPLGSAACSFAECRSYRVVAGTACRIATICPWITGLLFSGWDVLRFRRRRLCVGGIRDRVGSGLLDCVVRCITGLARGPGFRPRRMFRPLPQSALLDVSAPG